ncbi:MAG: family 43 glycosylhydrolase [Chloroflexi bacterium]|nr:family 43 glycosylhydrolase [Chloroflexota bacterium]
MRRRAPFTDAEGPIVTGQSFSAIDPLVLRTDDGSHYLYWGSADEPISARRLSADGLRLEGDPVEILPRSTGEYESLTEGAWITTHDGRY